MTHDRPHDVTMGLGDHLEELRRRIVFGLIGVGVGLVFMLFIAKKLVVIICQPLLYQLHTQGMAPSLEMPSVTSAFGVYIKVALLGAVVLGLPWLLYQGWLFIAPGLYKHERKFVVFLLPGSAALAATGVLFMYYVMLPITMWFFVTFASSFGMADMTPTFVQQRVMTISQADEDRATDGDESDPKDTLVLPVYTQDPAKPVEGQVWINTRDSAIKYVYDGKARILMRTAPKSIFDNSGYHVTEYISFVMWMAIAFAVSFQLPLVMLLLGWTGLMRVETMAAAWKYVLLGCFVMAMFLTPPDPISQVSMAVPMFLLYLFGLVLVKWTGKRKAGGGIETT